MSKFLKAMEFISPASINREPEITEEPQNPVEATPPVQQPKIECLEEGEKEELLTILLDIGNGVEEPITIYTNDKAETVAKDFAQKHGMSEKMEEKLRKHIQQTIDQIKAEIALEESERKENIVEDIKKKEAGDTIKASLFYKGSSLNELPVHTRLHAQAVSKQRKVKYTRDYCIVKKLFA